jgi:hypothetical protein
MWSPEGSLHRPGINIFESSSKYPFVVLSGAQDLAFLRFFSRFAQNDSHVDFLEDSIIHDAFAKT